MSLESKVLVVAGILEGASLFEFEYGLKDGQKNIVRTFVDNRISLNYEKIKVFIQRRNLNRQGPSRFPVKNWSKTSLEEGVAQCCASELRRPPSELALIKDWYLNLKENVEKAEKEQLSNLLTMWNEQWQAANWLQLAMQSQMQQQHQQQQQKPTMDLMEMMPNANPQIMEILAANGNPDLGTLLGQLIGLPSTTSSHNDDRETSVTPPPPPPTSVQSSLAGLMLPTTSNTNTTDSCQSSIIVNGNGAGNDNGSDAPSTPPAKKSKPSPSEESTLSDVQAANNSLMQLFGGLFPQNMSALPMMSQSPIHQQFAGFSDFDTLFAQMSKGDLLSSGGSTNYLCLASSGAPSSSSVLNEQNEEKEQQQQEPQSQQSQAANWLQLALQSQMQQQHQQQQQKPTMDLMEMMPNANPQIMEILAANGNPDLGTLLGQLIGLPSTTSSHNDDRETSVTPPPPPPTSVQSSLAGLMLPTTSNTNTTDSCQSSVIVNGNGAGNDNGSDAPSTPPAKKSKPSPSEESTLSDVQAANNSLMQLFGGLFPQNMSALPMMSQSPIHQQFAGFSDFDTLFAQMSKGDLLSSGGSTNYLCLASSGAPSSSSVLNEQNEEKEQQQQEPQSQQSQAANWLQLAFKMHGIVIDENKTVIANIDTTERERMGNLSFRCDTCMTEFKTRTQLRQHKQDVHSVMPLSTPRANAATTPIQGGKLSVPSTPTATNNSSSQMEDKCNFCDKRVPSLMMNMHVQQEHLGGGGDGAASLQQVMALLSAQSHRQEQEKDDPNLLKCGQCQYATRDARNMEMHQERHEQMNDAKQRRGSGEEDEDEALKLTTEAALNLSLHKSVGSGVKKENGADEDCLKTSSNHINERNSHTSSSISPSGDSIPEGFGKPIGNEKNYQTQSFIVRSNDDKGCFLGEFIAHLPVRSIVNGPRQMVFELMPTNSATNGI